MCESQVSFTATCETVRVHARPLRMRFGDSCSIAWIDGHSFSDSVQRMANEMATSLEGTLAAVCQGNGDWSGG